MIIWGKEIDFDAEIAATTNPRRIAWLEALRESNDWEYARYTAQMVECNHEGEGRNAPFCRECGQKMRRRWPLEWLRDQLKSVGLYPHGGIWWKWGGI